MKKRFVALLVMVIALCWATLAMAEVVAIAPRVVTDEVLKNTLDGRWIYYGKSSVETDFLLYYIQEHGKDGIRGYSLYRDMTFESINLSYDYDTRAFEGAVYTAKRLSGFSEYNYEVIVYYNRFGNITEIIAQQKSLGTTYTWQLAKERWYNETEGENTKLPKIDPDDYKLKIYFVDHYREEISEKATLKKEGDKLYYYNENGEKDLTYNDPAFEFEGGKFMILHGELWTEANGVLLMRDNDFYFYANGQVQEVTQLAEYMGEWFLLDNGKVNLGYTGLYPYDGAFFLLTEGRLRSDYTGPWTDATLGDLQIVNGQVINAP